SNIFPHSLTVALNLTIQEVKIFIFLFLFDIIVAERVMSAPRMKRLSKMFLMTSADRKKFEGVEKPLRTFSLVTFSFCSK
ncbi:hypothetical protein, partial [Lactobacillus crispatus]|uniref:hypothetical protein n=1 Tax=Lactobacillus crispatus TaxID=47770 RepID=UPI001F08BA6D